MSTSTPIDSHPTWCSPALCFRDLDGAVMHRHEIGGICFGQFEGDALEVSIYENGTYEGSLEIIQDAARAVWAAVYLARIRLSEAIARRRRRRH